MEEWKSIVETLLDPRMRWTEHERGKNMKNYKTVLK